MPAAIDTNILVYAEAIQRMPQDVTKIGRSRLLLRDLLNEGDVSVAAQALAELYRVFVGKLKLSRTEAAARIVRLQSTMQVSPTSEAVLANGIALATRHRLQVFDAIILAAAAEARCDVLYSEDFQHGFAWRGVEVVNPFR